MDALELLTDNQINAVVIVDQDELFEDTLTTTDFQGFLRENWMLLEKPVKEYREHRPHRKAITCKENATLREVIELFVNNKAHQISVLDDQRHAIGIVTLTDVLDFILKTTK